MHPFRHDARSSQNRGSAALSGLPCAAAALLAFSGSGLAQSSQPAQPQTPHNPAADAVLSREAFNAGEHNPDEPPLNDYLTYDNPQRWTARVQVDINAFSDSTRDHVEIDQWAFETLSVIFPVITATSAATGDPGELEGELRFADAPYTNDYAIIRGYPGDAYYTRWDAKNLQHVRDVTLVTEPRVRCWETTLDLDAAAKVGWPENEYPEEARSTFTQQFGVDFIEQDEDTTERIPEILRVWTEGRDPKSIPPLQLAKYLAGRVVERVQPVGIGLQRGRANRPLIFEGFRLLGADRTAAGGRGSPFDIACLLAAVYREAGLPARVVVGLREFDEYDTDDVSRTDLRGVEALYAYVEFFLYDEATGEQGWIPVDPVRIRRQSSRVKPLDQEWEYFGTHDELDHFIPLAMHFHPPTTVRAYGSPGFWGWFATPVVPGRAYQHLTFATRSTPVRAGD